MGASLRETGSRKPGLASRPGPTGFDPARIVGRVAQVLWNQRCPAIRLDPEDIPHYEAQAREVIAAMREPENAMLQGACKSHAPGQPMSPPGTIVNGWPVSEKECPRIRNRRFAWRQMIDTAIAMEAATAGETAQTGSTEGDSAGLQGIAQPKGPSHD